MSAPKTLAEMERIREDDRILREKQIRDFTPERNTTRVMANFQVERYVTGNFKGLFLVARIITEDINGRKLKVPLRQVISDGVDMVVAMSSLETALRKKVFR